MQSIYGGFTSGFQYSREHFHLFDLACVTVQRVINAVAYPFSFIPFNPESLKTAREQKWDRDVADLRRDFNEKPVVWKFCYETAGCIHAFVLRLGGEELSKVPGYMEYIIYYGYSIPWGMTYPARYLYRQFIKQGGKEAVLATTEMERLRGTITKYSTRISHLIGSPTARSLVNVEHVLLTVFRKVLKASDNPLPLKEVAFHRLAKSLAQQSELQKVWEKGGRTEAERKIALWDWLRKNGDLPRGLPDPDNGVFPENIAQKEHEALYTYVSGLVRKLLDKHAPGALRTGLSGAVYHLEGKDAIIHLATEGIIQALINQLADPDRFALSILLTQGEVMDLELDGYGLEKETEIFQTGQKILHAVQKGKSITEIADILERSKLKRSPGGAMGNRQKMETRKRLEGFFASLLLKMLQNPGSQCSNLKDEPMVGAGSLGWNFLMRVMNFSVDHLKQWKYFASDRVQNEIAKYFAKRMADLIYHPSWKIIVFQMLQELTESIENPPQEKKEIKKEDFETIASFLGHHFFGFVEARSMPSLHLAQTVTYTLAWVLERAGLNPVERTAGEMITDAIIYFKSEDLFEEFKKHLNPTTPRPLLEEGMEAMIPSIKEVLLYSRVIDAIRKEGKAIQDDTKFWEMYIRFALIHLVGQAAKLDSTHTDLVRLRGEQIDKMLIMNERELLDFLGNIRAPVVESFEWEDFTASLSQSWVAIENRLPNPAT